MRVKFSPSVTETTIPSIASLESISSTISSTVVTTSGRVAGQEVQRRSILRVKTQSESISRNYKKTDPLQGRQAAATAATKATSATPSNHLTKMDTSMASPPLNDKDSDRESSSSSLATSICNTSQSSQVSFENITIREYSRTIGDNPSVTSGVPISIDWEYSPQQYQISLEYYEENRPPRRSKMDMRVPSRERMRLLVDEWGINVKTVLLAVKSVDKCRMQRTKSAMAGRCDAIMKAEEILESVGRAFKYIIRLGQKPVPPHIREWKKKQKAICNDASRPT